MRKAPGSAPVSPAQPHIILESLEARVAPASFTYTELDGDLVQITSSKGTHDQIQAAAQLSNTTSGDLYVLNLNNNTAFAGSNITIKVITPGAHSDGVANVGWIDATNIDLGAVVIGGDIGKITAGDATYTTMGLKSVKAQSIGKYGNETQGNTGDLDWQINGSTASVSVANSVTVARLFWSAPENVSVGSITIGGDLSAQNSSLNHFAVADADGSIQVVSSDTTNGIASIGALKIGGSLIGDLTNTYTKTGYIEADKVGAVTIGGSLIGTDANNTGFLNINSIHAMALSTLKTSIASVTVGGSLIGGAGTNSGSIYAGVGAIGAVKVGGSVLGGSGDQSGEISTVSDAYNIGGVKVGGSLVGDGGQNSGVIRGAALGAVSIGGDIMGGMTDHAGAIFGHSATTVTVGGNVTGGGDNYTGMIFVSNVGSMTIGGNLTGGTNAFSGDILGTSLTGKLFIGGNIRGSIAGADAFLLTGAVQVDNLNSIEVGGSVIGGSNSSATPIQDSGAIITAFGLKAVHVHGNIESGISGHGNDVDLGGLRAGVLGTVQVDGSLIGNSTHSLLITGAGSSTATKGVDLAINKITVNGEVTYTDIVGGYTTSGTTFDGSGASSNGGSAQIGTVTIQGNFNNSSIVTGFNNHGFPWADMGGNNTLLPKTSGSTIVASIAKIVVNGGISATVSNGIGAQQIKALTLGGFTSTPPVTAFQASLTANDKLQLQIIPS